MPVPSTGHDRVRDNRQAGSVTTASDGFVTTASDTTRDRTTPGATPPAEVPPRRERLVADLIEAGQGSRRKSLLLICLAANGLLEGLALTALMPALNAGFSGGSSDGPLGEVIGTSSGAG